MWGFGRGVWEYGPKVRVLDVDGLVLRKLSFTVKTTLDVKSDRSLLGEGRWWG